MAVKPPNPKYIPKPYEKMLYPGQRVQIDVKVVPTACIVGDAEGQKFINILLLMNIPDFVIWKLFKNKVLTNLLYLLNIYSKNFRLRLSVSRLITVRNLLKHTEILKAKAYNV